MDSASSIAAVSDQNTNIIGTSEPRGEIVHLTVSSTSEDEELILEAISSSSVDMQSDLSSTSLVAASHIDLFNEESAGDSFSFLDNDDDYVRSLRRFLDAFVSESARQERQELMTYSRASIPP